MNICGSLAAQLIADAEGSTKTVAITVKGAATDPIYALEKALATISAARAAR